MNTVDTSYLMMQNYWWIVISILGSALVFLFFVQGGQSLLYSVAKTEKERTLLVNALGRKWELTFTTLVTFGGAFFASFPLFYSTSFGGAYWVWMAILFAFILQAVSYEYRSRPNNFLGKRTFETFLLINGLVGTTLVGVAVSTFFTGSLFVVDPLMHFSRWTVASHGLEAALNLQNLSLGLAVFFLSRVLGLLYFMNAIANDNIFLRSRKQLLLNASLFVVFFLFFVFKLITIKGFTVDPTSQVVSMEDYKYLHNLLAMPIVLILFLLGVVAVLGGIIKAILIPLKSSIWTVGIGTALVVFSLFCLAGFNHTAFYPSVADLQSSLTIRNASSSPYTLKTMTYVSGLVPFVLAIIIYTWAKINKTQITEEEMETGENHVY